MFVPTALFLLGFFSSCCSRKGKRSNIVREGHLFSPLSAFFFFFSFSLRQQTKEQAQHARLHPCDLQFLFFFIIIIILPTPVDWLIATIVRSDTYQRKEKEKKSSICSRGEGGIVYIIDIT